MTRSAASGGGFRRTTIDPFRASVCFPDLLAGDGGGGKLERKTVKAPSIEIVICFPFVTVLKSSLLVRTANCKRVRWIYVFLYTLFENILL
jgi:hypothetical protein